MKIDVHNAQAYLGANRLDIKQIRMIRKVLSNRGASWMVQKTMGATLSSEEKKQLLLFLDQEEKRLQKKENKKEKETK